MFRYLWMDRVFDIFQANVPEKVWNSRIVHAIAKPFID